jgi:uncharacterized protein YjbI with pentapeptide repeats
MTAQQIILYYYVYSENIQENMGRDLQPNHKPDKVALIIGMDEYDDDALPRLRSCKKDAGDLASLLSGLGYSIFDGFNFGQNPIIGSDLERQMGWARVRLSIGEFFTNARSNQLTLFYFSGHGLLQGNEMYLATREVDAQKPWITGFSVSDLIKFMNMSKARYMVSIIDACFSGSATIPNSETIDGIAKEAKAMKSTERIWTAMSETDRMCLLLSSQSFDQSFVGNEDQNSMYSGYLIEGLRGVSRTLGEEFNPGSIDENGNVTPKSLHEFIRYSLLSKTDHHPSLKCNNSAEIILASYPEKQKKILDNNTLFQLLRENNILEYNKRVRSSPYQSIDFHKRDLSGAVLDNGQLAMVNFNGCNLKSVSLEFANLYGSTLMDADLSKSNLYQCRLKGTNLRNANLEDRNLEYSFLDRADLEYANLTGASLKYANCTGADFQYAILERTNLYMVKDLPISVQEAKSRGAIFRQI